MKSDLISKLEKVWFMIDFLEPDKFEKECYDPSAHSDYIPDESVAGMTF